MPKLPSLTGDEIISALNKAGIYPVRKRGSHVILKTSQGKSVTVPVHKGRDVAKGTVFSIIEQACLSREEFLKLLRK